MNKTKLKQVTSEKVHYDQAGWLADTTKCTNIFMSKAFQCTCICYILTASLWNIFYVTLLGKGLVNPLAD